MGVCTLRPCWLPSCKNSRAEEPTQERSACLKVIDANLTEADPLEIETKKTIDGDTNSRAYLGGFG